VVLAEMMTRFQKSKLSHDVFIRIKEVYDILGEYGMNYDLSFRVENIQKGTDYDSGEFRMIYCGDDPIWG
jgi:hypothetical protein